MNSGPAFDPNSLNSGLPQRQNFGAGDRVLRIDGSEQADSIRIVETMNGMLRVSATIGGKHSSKAYDIDDFDRISVFGLDGNDTIENFSSLISLLNGGKGNDRIIGGTSDDRLLGGEGADYLRGGEGNDALLGGDGNDQLIGNDGDDKIRGGAGNDDARGDAGDDDIRGDAGNDRLRGGDGMDHLLGGAGHDILDGQWGEDTLRGQAGNDTLKHDHRQDSIFTGGQAGDVVATRYYVDTLDDVVDGNVSNGYLSIREALALSNDHDIVQLGRLVENGPATITMTQGTALIVDSSVMIKSPCLEGNIDLTIDAQFGSRIFDFKAGTKSHLEGVRLINGLAKFDFSQGTTNGDGGAIFVEGDLDLLMVDIIGNHSDSDGGAIYARANTTINADQITVSGNSANFRGGGIYLSQGAVANFTQSNIRSNSTEFFGGGVFNSGGTLNLDFSNLSSNWAKLDGGGIYQQRADANLNISYSSLDGNSAEHFGGVYVRGGKASMTASTFSNNQSQNSGGGAVYANADTSLDVFGSTFIDNAGLFGGAIATHGELNVTDYDLGGDPLASFFGNNTTPSYGGAIYADSGSTLDVHNTIFRSNSAEKGGAVFVASDNVQALFSDAEFTQNQADKMGGAVCGAVNSKIEFNGSSFFQNSSSSGGAIASNGWLAVTDDRDFSPGGGILFDGNVASNHGGGIYAGAGAQLNVTGGEYRFNEARNGGAIYTRSALDTTITGGDYFANKATQSGGAIHADSGTNVQANGISATGNIASIGGAISTKGMLHIMEDNGSVGFLRADFSDNVASDQGGAIYAAIDAHLDVDNADFNRNQSREGGAIYDGTSPLQSIIRSSSFIENKATESGGGIFTSGGSDTNIATTNFEFNEANQGGGLYVAVGGQAHVSDSTIYSNKAQRGAGVFVASDALVELERSVFDNNQAEHGGGLYVDDFGLAQVSSTTFANNTADRGGGIFVAGAPSGIGFPPRSLQMFNSQLTGNIANLDGGGLYIGDEASVSVEQTDFVNNFAQDSGGGIFQDELFSTGSELELSNSTFDQNKASSGGGLFVGNGSVANVFNVQFFVNEADRGGGLFIDSAGSATTTSSRFGGNRAEEGGGIYINGDADDVGSSQGGFLFSSLDDLTNNEATKLGGGIFIDEAAEANVVNATISKNIAEGGGGIFVDGGAIGSSGQPEGGSLLLDGSNVNDNQAVSGGGLMIWPSGSAKISNTSFMRNLADEGGAIFADGTPSATGTPQGSTLELFNSDLGSNTAFLKGGGLYLDENATAIIDSSEIIGNTSNDFGGGIYINGAFNEGGKLTLTNSQVDLNLSGSGGGVFVDQTGEADISNTTFSTNTAIQDGGALFVSENATAIVDAVQIVNNTATNSGGGIFVESDFGVGGTITLTNSQIEQNQADSGGGLFVSSAGNADIRNTTFDTNEALGDGGAIFVMTQAKIDIAGSTFTNNKALNAGAMYIESGDFDGATVNIDTSTFSQNQAEFGGAIVSISEPFGEGNPGGNVLTIKNSTIDNNTATQFGGAMILGGQDSIVNIINSTISSNNATAAAGIAVNVSQLNVTNSTIAFNKASSDDDDDCGGINISGGNVVLNNTIVFGNEYAGVQCQIETNGGQVDVAKSFNNLIGEGRSGGLIDGLNNNLVGVVDAGLDSELRFNNGGSTRTHALLDGSLAIDAGEDSLAVDENKLALQYDQNREPNNRIVGDSVDIGSVEKQN